MSSVSIVTASMNRTAHLIQSASRVAEIKCHSEHIIVDWSSSPPINRHDLPDDPRIRLIRVANEKYWHHSRAYNFAINQATMDIVCRFDADFLPCKDFFSLNQININEFRSNDPVLTGYIAKSSSGVFIAFMQNLHQVNGFNEYMEGWGYEDFDLYHRLRFFSKSLRLNMTGCVSCKHGDELRNQNTLNCDLRNIQQAAVTKTLTNKRNQWISSAVPWTIYSPASQYREVGCDIFIASSHPVLPLYLKETEQRLYCRWRFESIYNIPSSDFSDSQFTSIVYSLRNPLIHLAILSLSCVNDIVGRLLLKSLLLLRCRNM